MGIEIHFDGRNFNIWNTVVDSYEARGLSKQDAHDHLMKRAHHFADKYSCITCWCEDLSYMGEGIQLICGANNQPPDQCEENALKSGQIMLTREQYLRRADIENMKNLEKAEKNPTSLLPERGF